MLLNRFCVYEMEEINNFIGLSYQQGVKDVRNRVLYISLFLIKPINPSLYFSLIEIR